MTIACKKCGKEFVILEAVDAERAFCPYCGTQTEAVETTGELSFTEANTEEGSVQTFNFATDEQREELQKTFSEIVGGKQKNFEEEEQARLRKKEEKKKKQAQKRQEAAQAIKTVGKWAAISFISAAVLGGLIFLLVLLFQKNDAWTAWQWIIGVVVSVVFLLVTIGFVGEEEGRGIAFSMDGILTLLNALLYTIFDGGYSILFGCFSVCSAVGSIIVALSSPKDLEEGYRFFGWVEAVLTILLMIFGLIFGLPWAFWLWVIGITVGLVVVFLLIFALSDQERRESFLKVVGAILLLLLFASPIILTIVFGIILFANREQIEIISNFSGWCTFWVFFLIASAIYAIRFMYKLVTDHGDELGVGTIVFASLAVAVAIPVFVCGGKLVPNFNPPKFIHIEITNKETSIGYSTYDSKISMKITNQGNVTVTYVCGKMTMYNGSTQVGVWDVYFRKAFESGETYSMYVKFEEQTPDLYDISYEELGISYRITEMCFEDGYNTYEYNGETVVLKQAASTLPSDVSN